MSESGEGTASVQYWLAKKIIREIPCLTSSSSFSLRRRNHAGFSLFLGEGTPELFLLKGTDYPHVAG